MPSVLCASLISDNGPHVEILKAGGMQVRHAPQEVDLFVEVGLISQLSPCVASIAGSEPYTARVIEACPELRVIARSGVGYDAVDLEACDRNGVVVTTTPGVNHHAVAEHAIALLMGVARGFPELDRQVREGRWTRAARPRVMGSTLGIVGLGWIGRAMATRAVGLGMNVLACDPVADEAFAAQWGIELTTFDELLPRGDFISLHCFMSAENRHLMNAATLAKMKCGSVLINTSRGGLVDEAALYDALKSGHLRAAGLDVFETEPLPLDSPLLKLDNVLASGHVAGLDNQSLYDTFKMVAETILELRDGGWPAERIRNMNGERNWRWNRG